MKNMKTRDMIMVAMFAALICIGAYIVIPLPFSPVPITLQTLFIMMAGLILPVELAGMTVVIYLLLGIVGLPVFSGGGSGIGILFGPTGGYLVGFLIGVMVISFMVNKFKSNVMVEFISTVIGGIIVVYAIGVIWLSAKTGMGIAKAFTVGAVPFLIGDFMKAIVATVVAVPIRQYLKQSGHGAMTSSK